jgi:hypothetical protein
MNEVVPRFPLDAIGPVGIVMCVLLSLYGRSKIEQMLREDPLLKYYVHPHLKELPAFYATYAARSPDVDDSSPRGAPGSPGVPGAPGAAIVAARPPEKTGKQSRLMPSKVSRKRKNK